MFHVIWCWFPWIICFCRKNYHPHLETRSLCTPHAQHQKLTAVYRCTISLRMVSSWRYFSFLFFSFELKWIYFVYAGTCSNIILFDQRSKYETKFIRLCSCRYLFYHIQQIRNKKWFCSFFAKDMHVAWLLKPHRQRWHLNDEECIAGYNLQFRLLGQLTSLIFLIYPQNLTCVTEKENKTQESEFWKILQSIHEIIICITSSYLPQDISCDDEYETFIWLLWP